MWVQMVTGNPCYPWPLATLGSHLLAPRKHDTMWGNTRSAKHLGSHIEQQVCLMLVQQVCLMLVLHTHTHRHSYTHTDTATHTHTHTQACALFIFDCLYLVSSS